MPIQFMKFPRKCYIWTLALGSFILLQTLKQGRMRISYDISVYIIHNILLKYVMILAEANSYLSKVFHLKKAILPLLRHPLLHPHSHPLPTLRTPHINGRNDTINPQCTNKHGQLAKAAMLRIRHTITSCTLRASSLRSHVLDRIRTAPVIAV